MRRACVLSDDTTSDVLIALRAGDFAALRGMGAERLARANDPAIGRLVHDALARAQFAELREVVALGEELGVDLSHGWSRVLLAALLGDLPVLQTASTEELLHRTKDGESVLHAAARAGHVHVVDWVLDVCPELDVNVTTGVGLTPLHLAANGGHVHVIDRLVERGAVLSKTTNLGGTALTFAAHSGREAAVTRLLALAGDELEIDKADNRGGTALHYAAQSGHTAVIDLLVRAGARVDSESSWCGQPLHCAARQGHVAAVEMLVERGAALEAVTLRGEETPLHVAAGRGLVDAVKRLVELGANPNAANHVGENAVFCAAANGHAEVVRVLSRLGTDVNVINSIGQTAIHVAARAGMSRDNAETIRVLLELGVDRTVRDSLGQVALDIAKWQDGSPTVEVLETYFPAPPCMTQLLLGLRGPTPSPLTRFAEHALFEPKVMSLVKCLLVGGMTPAMRQLIHQQVRSREYDKASATAAATVRAVKKTRVD